ncbi:nucleotide disphospho-sugar-binding domain-containing protein [Streptomyces kanamyceticus]|uniref:nucleotide disphospho-sugar-binding domain-containing protein n=1 Tax=Streptomyces kanamyceticus TaxID=1967 RepID=UPI0037DBF638
MRVLFVTAVLPSHYFVMAPFAWALRAAGHEVRVATQPELVETVARSGLPVISMGEDADFARRFRNRARARGPRSGDPKELFCDIADGMADDLVAFARAWRPDAVVWEPATLAGPLAAAACDAVSLRYLWGPDIVGRGIGRGNLPPRFAELFERFGMRLEDVPDWWNLDACPDDAQVTGNTQRLPVRYVPYSGAGHVPAWVLRSSGRPRVCVTLGITMTEVAGEETFFVPKVLEALSGLDVELVAAVVPSQRRLLGEVPDGVRIAEDCALYKLVPSCDLVVHHGGVGSMLTAALNGVPQLMITQMPDQGFFSTHLARTGAGVHLAGDQANPKTLRETVSRMLEDLSCREAAAGVRQSMLARPTPAECVPIVEGLVAEATTVQRSQSPRRGVA